MTGTREQGQRQGLGDGGGGPRAKKGQELTTGHVAHEGLLVHRCRSVAAQPPHDAVTSGGHCVAGTDYATVNVP